MMRNGKCFLERYKVLGLFFIIIIFVSFCGCGQDTSIAGSSDTVDMNRPASVEKLYPEPKPLPYRQRDNAYSIVWFYLVDDPDLTRQRLQTVKDMGIRRTQALIYYWKFELRGSDFWKQRGYSEKHVGPAMKRALDYYIRISHELGMQPSLRVGTCRVFQGRFHPLDEKFNSNNYCKWISELISKYRGKIDHIVIGDEENKSFSYGWRGTAKEYMNVILIPIATAIRKADPNIAISATAVSSAPATDWILQLVKLGLPKYADGVAGNLACRLFQNPCEIKSFVKKLHEVWAEAKLFANGFGYVENFKGLHDRRQAGILAQCAFTVWDFDFWHSQPYYLYRFSMTRDTHQNFGILKSFPNEGKPAVITDAWKAYQTIAQTFYNRKQMQIPEFKISLQQAERLKAADGTTFTLAPPKPILRAFIRDDRQLLIYIAYRNFMSPLEGKWNIIVETPDWSGPQLIPLLDYKKRENVKYHRDLSGRLVIKDVKVGLEPTILTLRRVIRTPSQLD